MSFYIECQEHFRLLSLAVYYSWNGKIIDALFADWSLTDVSPLKINCFNPPKHDSVIKIGSSDIKHWQHLI